MTAFRDALLATGFDPAHVKLLHDNQPARFLPEKTKILAELALLLDGLDPADTVVVALSGHGVHFKGDKTGYFCPVDAALDKKETLIPFDGDGGLFTVLKACKAKRKLLIVNACRNDPATDTAMAATKVKLDDEYPEEVPEGIAAIYSCQKGQKSYYDPDRKRGIFFDHVVRAWRGEYTDGPPTLEAFFSKVKTKTKADADGTFQAAQVPEIKRVITGGGEWLLGTAVAAVARGEPKPGDAIDIEMAAGVKMRFCWVPAGEFWMGAADGEADASEDEKPQRRLRITKGFWLGKHEVTQAEYEAVAGKNPSYFGPDGGGKEKLKGLTEGRIKRLPVETVSWDEAKAFFKKANAGVKVPKGYEKYALDLPTEAQWEYACRGEAKGTAKTTPFQWGGTLNGAEANCNGNFPYGGAGKGDYVGRTTPVGTYAKASPHTWGLADMHGNVWEWCEDYYGAYKDIEAKSDKDGWLHDPFQKTKQSEERRVVRGGSWSDVAWACRAAHRRKSAPDRLYYSVGFRASFRLD